MTFLTAEPLIKARIKSACPAFLDVASLADINDIADSQQVVPAAHIVYDGYSVVDVRKADGVALIEEDWLIVVCAFSAANNREGSDARSDVAILVGQLVSALTDWRPSAGHQPMELRTPSSKPGYLDGFVYVPVQFATRFTTRNP